MLCAKYDYKMDIAVKKQEAYEDGLADGLKQKAVEDAKNFYKNGASLELISKSLGITLEEVKKIVSDVSEKEMWY